MYDYSIGWSLMLRQGCERWLEVDNPDFWRPAAGGLGLMSAIHS